MECDCRQHLLALQEQESLRHGASLSSLSDFLLSVASANDTATSSSSNGSGGGSVTVQDGSKALVVCHHDVVQIYGLLFREFAKLSALLVTDVVWFNNNEQDEERGDGGKRRYYSEVLCCCIRIIPVLDMFNTSLSHSASMAVTDLLHQLCSMPGMSPMGGRFAAKEQRHIALRTCLLEVFLNEMLIHQDMRCPFLQGGEQPGEFVAGSQLVYSQHRASMEAAFAHMRHQRLLLRDGSAATTGAGNRLGLAARVLLLDVCIDLGSPSSVLAHVMSLVAGALHPESELRQPSLTDGFQGELPLPHGVTIGLAASVVETAMGLLSRHYSASITSEARGGECSTVTYSCSGGAPSPDWDAPLVAVLLRAIACALVRIVGEVGRARKLGLEDEDDALRVRALNLGIKRAMESVAGAFSFNMPSVKCLETIGCFDQSMIQALRPDNSAAAIGWTLVFFAHLLWYESQRGMEQVLAVEYLRVLDSLLGLLFFESNCRIMENYPQLLGESSNSAQFFVQTMIKPLQRAVFDLYTNKKPITELLAFISKATATPLTGASPSIPNTYNPEQEEEVVESVPEEESAAAAVVEHSGTSFKTVRASTMAIVRRLQQRRRRQERDEGTHRGSEEAETTSTRKKARTTDSEDVTSTSTAVAAGNSFITHMMCIHKYEESFEDLEDFIVCKEGRNYSKFYNRRIKCRRKNHTRLIWKRREEKRELLRLLDITHD